MTNIIYIEIDSDNKGLCPWCNEEREYVQVVKSEKSRYALARCVGCKNYWRLEGFVAVKVSKQGWDIPKIK